ncbi:hypothetical protein [Aquihabitans sp. McL0605]|uniref:hypothetical protein n=1 Tax=Aquihabitans sp. McL0605 TaxID=3415671 RepID=UPI003CF07546
MRPGRRDQAVRRWLRRPLWWLGASVLIVAALFGSDLVAFPRQQRAAHGQVVEGRILGSWDGGTDVPVAYTSNGGDEVTATARTTDGSDERVGPVRISVDPDHPTDAHLQGFDQSQLWVGSLTLLGPAVAAILLWWWTRRRRVRRSEALAASDVPSFRMIGVPRPGRVSPRRWRMGLYPLDAPVGAAPVCSVAMIDGDDDIRPRMVEVKGQPRPGGEVVVWEPATDRVWWPAARVLLSGTRKLPERAPQAQAPTYSAWRWAVPIVAAVVMIAAFESGESPEALKARSEVVLVTVVTGHGAETGPTLVSYRLADGSAHRTTVALAGPQRTGDRYRLRADPEHPDRLWQPGTSESLPGAGGSASETVGTLALLVLVLGIVVVRRPRPRQLPTGYPGLVGPRAFGAPRLPPPPPASP